MKILFVCTGNTCRSPMAEGIMKVKAEKEKLDLTAESAGLCAFTGDEVSPNAVKAAKFFGADIKAHRAKKINTYYLEDADIIVCMTQSHKNALMPFVAENKLINLDVSDPYGGDEEEYLSCAKEIEQKLDNIIKKLKNITIQKITEADVEAIAEIERECFSHPWSEDGIRQELTNENARFFTAKKMGRTVGYIGMHIVLDECYIANIAVLPSQRRQGIGEKLLCFAESVAEKEGCGFISLEVRVSNEGAISLYEKRGFQKMGERKNFYSAPTENGLIMTKNFKEE